MTIFDAGLATAIYTSLLVAERDFDHDVASNLNDSLLLSATTTTIQSSVFNASHQNNSTSQWHQIVGDSRISSYSLDRGKLPGLMDQGGGGEGVRAELEDTFVETHKEFVFDRTDVRIVFITLYSLVFCCCFFGNLLVILVVTLSRRLRSITNFFLANLAVADLCVGIFCVMQNLSIYLITSWVFGDFLCKMYQFVHSLSSTASIFILVVICMERYFAIIHPITCKQKLTSKRLRMVIVGVWITSAIYSLPKFIYVHTVTVQNDQSGSSETICVPNRRIYNSEVLDMINFVLLYITPLLVMTLLYSRIAVTLWQSSRQLDYCIPMRNLPSPAIAVAAAAATAVGTLPQERNESPELEMEPEAKEKRGSWTNSNVKNTNLLSVTEESPTMAGVVNTPASPSTRSMFVQHKMIPIPQSSHNVLRARRGVIRMLIVVVLTFALCNLPFHARKIWQYWSKDYEGDSNFIALFTPLTFLLTYFNSGVNPLLYAFLSRNFRNGIREVFQCIFRRTHKGTGTSSLHRGALPNHSMATETKVM